MDKNFDKTELFKELIDKKHWMPLTSSDVNINDVERLLSENDDDVEYCKFIARSMKQRCHALENEINQKNERIAKIECIAKSLFDIVQELLPDSVYSKLNNDFIKEE